jgi:hypothetical protein
MTTAILTVVAIVFFGLYLMRRRARLTSEE